MKHLKLFLILMLITSTYIHAKKIDLKKENAILKQEIELLREDVQKQQDNQVVMANTIEHMANDLVVLQESLKKYQLAANKENRQRITEREMFLNKISDSTEETYKTIQQNKKENQDKFLSQSNEIFTLKDTCRRYLYIILSLLCVGLGFSLFAFIKLRRNRLSIIKLDTQLKENNECLNNSFQKQVEMLQQIVDGQISQKSLDEHQDFSLALKVADEITLMERNMSFMSPEVKGYKQLKRSIQNLKDKLNTQGYEIPELLGRKFDLGMKLAVISSFPSSKIPKGEEIISKIIKPQVNYKGKMIQSAQVEISIGE